MDNLATLYGEMVETRNSEGFAGPNEMVSLVSPGISLLLERSDWK